VSFLKPKFVLLALFCALLPATFVSGCSGGAFSEDGSTGTAGSSSGSGGTSSNAGSGMGKSGSDVGTGAGTGTACGGPEDCDDGKVCTTDRCNADGTCDASPKCGGTEKCCDGDCAECCDDADCDDHVMCTDNTCFSGQCMYVPNDMMCEPTEYCSTKDNCRPKQACGIVPGEGKDICADDSACTIDSCEANFCKHDFCPDANAKLCCEGVGCAACCNDSQCDTDNDPCTVGSCKDGKCELVALCGAGQDCCPSADRKTATCGACCSATDCDDKIGCTDDKCGGGQCSNTPNNSHCDAGYLCNPDPAVKGCVKAPDCTSPSQCHPTACQSNARCDGGTCHFDTCSTQGLKCCAGVAGSSSAGCAICCADAECSDTIPCTKDVCTANGCTHTPDNTACQPGQKCDAQRGCVGCLKDTDCDDGLPCTTDVCNNQAGGTFTCLHSSTCQLDQYCTANGCSQCVSDSDCQGGVITAAVPIPPNGCSVSSCVKGQCQTVVQDCGDFQFCCPPYGCQLNCNIQTQ
jgi:hypothetical protein